MKAERKLVTELDPQLELGLTSGQVQQRMEAGWDNRVAGGALRSQWQILADHCFTFFNLVFAVLALILALVGSSVVNFGFLGVVLFNLAIGVVQEIRAKRAVEKLTLIAARQRKVLRDGAHTYVEDGQLVRDDLVVFAAGEQLCADGVVRSGRLLVNEALITGEPEPVEKREGDEIMSGSLVVAGKATVQLIRVGNDSYAARMAAEAKGNPKAGSSQMMQDLQRLIRVLSLILVPLGVLYFLGEVAVPYPDRKQAAEQTVAALVSMIPQGLYLLTSVAMAVSAIRLSKKRVLVQDMSCIETLARVDVLCVDKTGTITQPGMQVEELIPLCAAEPDYYQQVLGSLFAGEPDNDTARALKEMFWVERPWEQLCAVEFTSEQKWSGSVFSEGSFVVGAPDVLMAQRWPELAEKVQPWSTKGFRVLLLAGYEGKLKAGALDSAYLTPLALVLLKSRIRETAFDTFRFFEKQGVAVKVLSGDDPATAADAANRAGIRDSESYVNCEGLSKAELEGAAEKYTVFGRVTPEQKRMLIEALKKSGHTVAMTGDGVNDVLAMRQAHCAVAMACGAQAAGQVAQLVLLDSDFSAMPQIVAEGRRVVGNIRRAAALFLVKNIFTILLVLTALLTSLVYPFQPVTLTVINALTVGIPSLVLALEPNWERIRGRFLASALEQALPGGLAAFAMLVIAQLLPLQTEALAAVSAIGLAAVGLAVLLRVSAPLTALRKGIIGLMTLGLVLSFGLLGPVFGVYLADWHTGAMALLMVAVGIFLMMAFSALQVKGKGLYLRRHKL